MKPGAAWREEPWWHWDWPGRPHGQLIPGMGAQHLAAPEAPSLKPAACLWVPDPEQQHGWREYYVYHEPPPIETPRKLGL